MTIPRNHPKALTNPEARGASGAALKAPAVAGSRARWQLAPGSQVRLSDPCPPPADPPTRLRRPSPRACAVRQHRRRVDRRRAVGAARRVCAAAAAGGRGAAAMVPRGRDRRISSRTSRCRACCRCRAWTAGTASARARPCSSSGTATARSARCRPPARISAVRCGGSAKDKKFSCPCHGGVYAADGQRRRRAAAAAARHGRGAHRSGDRLGAGAAVKRLFDWLQARTGYRGRRRRDARRAAAAGHRLVLHARQRAPRAAVGPAAHRRVPHALLRADARSRVRQRPLHHRARRPAGSSAASITTAPASSSSRWCCTCCA